jgi:hypothetical protein
MKKTILVIVAALMIQVYGYSQTKALTSDGNEVLLFNDGTWKYVDGKSANESREILTNASIFKKNAASSFEVKSKKVNASVFINPKKWKFTPGESGDAGEYDFDFRNGDVYGMIITERTEIPLEALKDIAVKNARDVAPDIDVAEEEYRMVNNKKVLCLQMNGTIKGIQFSYFGYYFSSPNGTIQFLTYTSKNLFLDNRNEMQELLNGLVVTNN